MSSRVTAMNHQHHSGSSTGPTSHPSSTQSGRRRTGTPPPPLQAVAPQAPPPPHLAVNVPLPPPSVEEEEDGRVMVSEPLTFEVGIVVGFLGFVTSAACVGLLLLGDNHSGVRVAITIVAILTQLLIFALLHVYVCSPMKSMTTALTMLNDDLLFDDARELVLTKVLSSKSMWGELRVAAANLALTCVFLGQVKPYIPESVFLRANEDDDSDGEPAPQRSAAVAPRRNPLEVPPGSRHGVLDAQVAGSAVLSEPSIVDDGVSSVEDMTLRHDGLLGELPPTAGIAGETSLSLNSTSMRSRRPKHKGTRIVKATPTTKAKTDTDTEESEKGTIKSIKSAKSHVSTEVGASIDIYNAKASKRVSKLQGGDGFRVRNATILQVDLYGCEPQHIVNLFINSVSECTKYYGGVALTVTGSCFVATWNAYKTHHGHATQACKCAIDFHQKLKSLTGRHHTTWRASIATGAVRIGFVGSESIRAPAVTGEAAQLTSKLGLLGTQTGAKILISNETYNLVRDAVFARPIEVITLEREQHMEGIHGEAVYELVSLPGHTSAMQINDVSEGSSGGLTHQPDKHDLYLDAISALRRAAWRICVEKMTLFLQANPTDKQAIRIIKIASFYATSDSAPTEYIRPFIGWQDLESLSSNVPMPEDLSLQDVMQDTIQYDYVRDPVLPDEHKLQDKIREASALAFGTPVAGEVDSPPNSLIDTNGGKWLLLGKVLGSGAFGTVRLGMSSGGGLVAVKCMTKLQKCQEIVEEVGVMADLQHENTVSYLGSGLSHHTAFVVMEWVCGGSLKDVLKSCGGPLPTSVSKRYSQDILKGLRYLHHKGILHRDLKPHNVLVTPEGLCKLADFGASAKLSSALRKQGMVGTPMYMSPESCRGEAVQASDVWSFGITICQLLSYELPYQTNAATKFRSFLYVVKCV